MSKFLLVLLLIVAGLMGLLAYNYYPKYQELLKVDQDLQLKYCKKNISNSDYTYIYQSNTTPSYRSRTTLLAFVQSAKDFGSSYCEAHVFANVLNDFQFFRWNPNFDPNDNGKTLYKSSFLYSGSKEVNLEFYYKKVKGSQPEVVINSLSVER
jgi:hypothetical protein